MAFREGGNASVGWEQKWCTINSFRNSIAINTRNTCVQPYFFLFIDCCVVAILPNIFLPSGPFGIKLTGKEHLPKKIRRSYKEGVLVRVSVAVIKD